MTNSSSQIVGYCPFSSPLSPGIYTVTFGAVTGYDTPATTSSAVDQTGGTIIGAYAASAPSAPTGVTATAGDRQVTISWTAVAGATSYNVYRRTSAGVTTANGTKVTGATSGSAITGLTNGQIYYFVVTAVNSGGESAISNEVSTTPNPTCTIPQVPQNGVCVTPHYADNGNGTITDIRTGLMWQQQDDDYTRVWAYSDGYCRGLTLGGYSGWRSPTAFELGGLVEMGQVPTINPIFTNTKQWEYWTSNCYAGYLYDTVNFSNSYEHAYSGVDNFFYVRCVRP